MKYFLEDREYNLFIISLGNIKSYFNSSMDNIAIEFNYDNDVYEDIYDWVVTRAAYNILRTQYKINVREHYRQDFYLCIFDKIGIFIQNDLSNSIRSAGINFESTNEVKVMVAGSNLIIAKKINYE